MPSNVTHADFKTLGVNITF